MAARLQQLHAQARSEGKQWAADCAATASSLRHLYALQKACHAAETEFEAKQQLVSEAIQTRQNDLHRRNGSLLGDDGDHNNDNNDDGDKKEEAGDGSRATATAVVATIPAIYNGNRALQALVVELGEATSGSITKAVAMLGAA